MTGTEEFSYMKWAKNCKTPGEREYLKKQMENRSHVVKFKCHDCLTIVTELPCPNCGSTTPTIMCPLDHPCTCTGEIHGGAHVCPACQEFICPCGSHDVIVLSRVTGYIADVAGWGKGKRAELMDRIRYDVAGSGGK